MKIKIFLAMSLFLTVTLHCHTQERTNEVRQKISAKVVAVSEEISKVIGWSKIENTEGKFWQKSDINDEVSYLPGYSKQFAGFKSFKIYEISIEENTFYILNKVLPDNSNKYVVFNQTPYFWLEFALNDASGKDERLIPIRYCGYQAGDFNPELLLQDKEMIRVLLLGKGAYEYYESNQCKGDSVFLINSQVIKGDTIVRFNFELYNNQTVLNKSIVPINEDYFELKLNQFKKIFHLSPYISENSYIQNGLTKMKSNDYFGAITEFRNALRNNPNNPYHYKMIGLCNYSIRNYSGAITCYSSAIEKTAERNDQAELFESRGSAKLAIKDTIGAISDYTSAVDNSNIQTKDTYKINLGVLFIKLSKYKEAKEQLKYINKIDSTLYLCYKKMAYSYFEKQDYDNTITTCGEILKNEYSLDRDRLYNQSDRPSILLLRALANTRLGKIDFEDVNSVLKLNPNLVEAYVFRGKLYLLGSKGYVDKQGKIHKDDVDISNAISDFTEAIKLNPQLTEAYIARAKAKIEEAYNKFSTNSFKDVDGAMLDFDKALEINPNIADALIGRADLKIRLKDYKNAIIDCDIAIQSNQNSGEAYCIRGLAQVKLFKKKLGCDDFQKAIELGYLGANEYINTYCK